MPNPVSPCIFASCLLSLSSIALAQSTAVPLNTEDWQISQSVAVSNDSGSPHFVIDSGRAIHRELRFENGTIELEMKISGLRAFSYVQFRIDESGRNYEEIYFRTHKSLAPDALQYTPVDNGISAWQLYHGEGKTAPVALPADRWIELQLIVSGNRAAVFVGGAKQPDLVMQLARSPTTGAIGLRGFVAPGSTAPFAAEFRNLRVSKQAEFDFAAYDRAAADKQQDGSSSQDSSTSFSIIDSWRLSDSFSAPRTLVVTEYQQIANRARQPGITARVDSEGLLNIGKVIEQRADRPWATVASVTLEAPSATRQRIDLGYSDAVSVFLNGELLFTADDSYLFDRPRRQGLIGFFQASLYLPLEQGSNRLEIVVADAFGGWGLMARLVDSEVTARP